MREEAGFKRWGEGDGVGVVLEDMGLTLDEFSHEGGGGCVEPDADGGVEEAEEIGVLLDFGVDDDALFGGKSFEGFDESVGAVGVLFRGLFLQEGPEK